MIALPPRPPSRCARAPRSARSSGFSLFEVLLALVIFGGAMAVLGQLMSNGARAAVQSRLRTQAVLRCESKLAELISGIEPLQAASDTPFVDDDRWTWSAVVGAGPTSGLLLVQVTVSHRGTSQMGSVTYTLSRWIKDPQWVLDIQSLRESAAATEDEL